MAEYIKKDAIIDIFNAKGDMAIGTPKAVFFSAAKMIEKFPAADVAEVRHGKWIDCIETGTSVAGVEITGLIGYRCSLCGRYEGKKEPYCNCGAKMDLGR